MGAIRDDESASRDGGRRRASRVDEHAGRLCLSTIYRFLRDRRAARHESYDAGRGGAAWHGVGSQARRWGHSGSGVYCPELATHSRRTPPRAALPTIARYADRALKRRRLVFGSGRSPGGALPATSSRRARASGHARQTNADPAGSGDCPGAAGCFIRLRRLGHPGRALVRGAPGGGRTLQ